MSLPSSARPDALPASPAPARFAAPGWLDLRLVIGVLLVLGSVILGARVVSSADERAAVWRTTHALAAGTVLTPDDLEAARVQLGDTKGYVPASRLVTGTAVIRDIGAGELLAAGALADAPPSTTVTIPVAALNTPKLERGQRVAIWVSTDVCQGAVVLPEAAVQEVSDDRGGFSSALSIAVVVKVDADMAARIVRALDLPDAVIRIGVLEGAPAPVGPLPDLAPCAAGR